MALVIPPNEALVVHSLTLAGDPEPMAVTYGIRLVPAPNLANAVVDVANAFKALVLARFSNQYTLTNTELQYVALAGDPPLIYTSAITQVGGGTSTVCPQNTAFLVHKRTAQGGRTGRGRFYWPGVAESDVDSVGTILPATVTANNTNLATFLAAVKGSAEIDEMVLLHDSNGAGASMGSFPITLLQMDTRAATQRRRMRR